jgi:hypothetical protein
MIRNKHGLIVVALLLVQMVELFFIKILGFLGRVLLQKVECVISAGCNIH